MPMYGADSDALEFTDLHVQEQAEHLIKAAAAGAVGWRMGVLQQWSAVR